MKVTIVKKKKKKVLRKAKIRKKISHSEITTEEIEMKLQSPKMSHEEKQCLYFIFTCVAKKGVNGNPYSCSREGEGVSTGR